MKDQSSDMIMKDSSSSLSSNLEKYESPVKVISNGHQLQSSSKHSVPKLDLNKLSQSHKKEAAPKKQSPIEK